MGWLKPIEVLDATNNWDDVERLFGRAGASNGCWCQYWMLGADYKRREPSQNRDDLKAQVRRGVGLLAYREGEPVGWGRFTPRDELDWLLNRFPHYDFGSANVWSLSCFFIARSARGQGVMTNLINHATKWGVDHDTIVEAYPIDPAVEGATLNTFSGTLQAFLCAGYREQGRLAKDRVVVASS